MSFYIILSIAIICGWLQYYLELTSITLQVSDEFAIIVTLQFCFMLIIQIFLHYFRYAELNEAVYAWLFRILSWKG